MKEKRFTIVMPDAPGVSERSITAALVGLVLKMPQNAPSVADSIKVWENNKKHTCDGCGKNRRDVKACGKDSNGDPDAPDLCFICRKMGERRKVWSFKQNRYVFQGEDPNDTAFSSDDISWSGL